MKNCLQREGFIHVPNLSEEASYWNDIRFAKNYIT